ncbi:MAG: heme ABC transporter ATP-binding protein [Chloroflexota bacterium]
MEKNGRLALSLVNIEAGYTDGLILSDLSLDVRAGEMVGILGPNGSGKTTLLRVASGVLKPSKGTVALYGQTIGSLKRREIARRVAVVPQDVYVPFSLTVAEIVLMGRTPHTGSSGEEDREMVAKAMLATSTLPLGERVFNELSGGEKQRVLVAMALAQEPEVLLLDEPTVHLDINHQLDVMSLVRRLNQEQGLTVLATMHDLNLAALFFDRLVLIERGHKVADGPPEQVLSVDHIKQVFGADVQVQTHPVTRAPQVVLLPRGHK